MVPIRMRAIFSIAVAILVILPAIAYATDYMVGDGEGWTSGFDYSKWAKDKKFRVGDALIFNYSVRYHNVAKVNAEGFSNCAVPPNATVLSSGNDKIVLTTTGNKWYMCGFSGHCQAGQKLKITVLPKSMIGGPPSPAPEAGIPWAPATMPTPGYLPESEMNSVPIPAPDSEVPWLPLSPSPVGTPGYLPWLAWPPAPAAAPGYSPEAAMESVPTIPPDTDVPLGPMETPGYMPGEEEPLQLVPTRPPSSSSTPPSVPSPPAPAPAPAPWSS